MKKFVSILTDFGWNDPYVGIMKGVMLSIEPELTIVDITHDSPNFDVRSGSYLLWASASDFPKGTVFLVVIDPGVGSSRNALIAEAGGYYFVGPDNGVLWETVSQLGGGKFYKIENREFFYRKTPSSTFHGRDIFAPAAAHLAKGVSPENFGPRVEDEQVEKVSLFTASKGKGAVRGEVIYIDHYGNAATNIRAEDFDPERVTHISVGELQFPRLHRSFFEVEVGKPLVYINSFGLLEIGVREGSAAGELGLEPGSKVEVYYK